MAVKAKKFDVSAESDMTPMIDMTFQLIAFFMILINFSDSDQNERIKLPGSILAKPPDAPLESAIHLQLAKEGVVLYNAEQVPIASMHPQLAKERRLLELKDKSPASATIIIRADALAKTGMVQELIKVCQEEGFEKFALRAKTEAR